MDRGVKKPRVWEQTIPVETEVITRTYHCPVCNVPLFSVPTDLPVPEEKEVVVCPNGHKAKVPAFPKFK